MFNIIKKKVIEERNVTEANKKEVEEFGDAAISSLHEISIKSGELLMKMKATLDNFTRNVTEQVNRGCQDNADTRRVIRTLAIKLDKKE